MGWLDTSRNSPIIVRIAPRQKVEVIEFYPVCRIWGFFREESGSVDLVEQPEV